MTSKRTALVTGASSGMGKDIAKRLIKDGYHVVVAARRVDQMDDLKQLGAYPVALDVSKDDSIQAAMDEITAQVGGIDVLVNNAGFGLYGAVEDIPINDARYQFEVNLFGLARLTQMILPHMRSQKSGTIINISSMGGRIYTPLGAWYHASKHAVEGFSDCLRIELKPFGVNVVVIQPGMIQTPFGSVLEGPMMKYSGKGAYAGLAKSISNATTSERQMSRMSPPTVIADTVSKALVARRPKTRYAVGSMAKPLMWMRKWLGDRLFDRILLSVVR